MRPCVFTLLDLRDFPAYHLVVRLMGIGFQKGYVPLRLILEIKNFHFVDFPPQTEVYTSAWAVTHDPRNFHEPMTFIPERWLDPECKDVKEASQPFSLGYRACIGRK